MGGGTTMLPDDLPEDMPSFVARFGSDEQCREYLFKARWPDGFRCSACGHDDAYALKTKIVYECVACRKQHSLLAGTIFEQTKAGWAKWFLAIYLVTSSKGGIAATELKRQPGLGSYQTAWTWLHKLRKAMVRPDREPLAGRVEADETYVGGPRPGKRGRGAAGKTLVGGAVEAGRGEARGRRLGRLRLASLADASAESLEAFLAAHVAKPATVTTDGWRGYLGLPAKGYDHEPLNLGATPGPPAARGQGAPPPTPSPPAPPGAPPPPPPPAPPPPSPPPSRGPPPPPRGGGGKTPPPPPPDGPASPSTPRTAERISHGFARLI